jgi:hypothetical protein
MWLSLFVLPAPLFNFVRSEVLPIPSLPVGPQPPVETSARTGAASTGWGTARCLFAAFVLACCWACVLACLYCWPLAGEVVMLLICYHVTMAPQGSSR